MKKRYFVIPLICLLLSLCAAWLVKIRGQYSKLSLCRDLSVTADGRICGIDYSARKQKYMIFRCDKEGNELEAISPPSVNNDCRRVYDYLAVDGANGRVYVHISEYGRVSGLLKSEEIDFCDFERGKLKKAWTLPAVAESMAPTAKTAYIYDGVLFYLSEENGVEVYSCDADGEFTKVRELKEVGGVSGYGFFDGGSVAVFGTKDGLFVEKNGALTRKTAEKSAFVNLAWGSSSAGFTDINNDVSYIYRAKTDSLETLDFAESLNGVMNEREIESSCEIGADMLSNIRLFDGGFAAYSELPEEFDESADDDTLRSCLAVYENKTLRLYKALGFSEEHMKDRFRSIALTAFLVSTAVYAVIELIAALCKARGYVSLSAETVLLAVVFFGTATCFTGFKISAVMTSSFDESYEKVFDDLESEMSAEMDHILSRGNTDVFSDEFHSELSEIMQNTLVTNLKTGEQEFAPYFVLHVPDEKGRLIMIYNNSGKEGIPTSYVYGNRYTNGKYAEVLESGRGANITQYDPEGIWDVKLGYYENDAANVRAVIEIGIDRYMTDRKTEIITSEIVGYILLLCGFFITTVIFFIAVSFAPVRRLTGQIAGCDVEKPEKNCRCFELDRIREQLYVMTRSVRERLENIETNNAQHYRFVSPKLIRLLGVEGIESAHSGTTGNFDGVFAELVFEDRGADKINELYEWLFPILDGQDGVICEVKKCRVSVLFPRESLCDCRECLDKIALKSKERFDIRAAAGIGFGEGVICVVGTDDFAYTAVLSEERDSARTAAERAFDGGSAAAVCLTENALSELSGGIK